VPDILDLCFPVPRAPARPADLPVLASTAASLPAPEVAEDLASITLLRAPAITGTSATKAAAAPQPRAVTPGTRSALGPALTRADANLGLTVARIPRAPCAAACLR
jgi:hypothetical protein